MENFEERLKRLAKDYNLEEDKVKLAHLLWEKVLASSSDLKERYQDLLVDYLKAGDRFDFSFDVISDPHVEKSYEKTSVKNFQQALQDLHYLNPTSEALLVPGDFTSAGQAEEYQTFFKLLAENKAPQPIVALGNHDVRWLETPEIFKERYFSHNGQYMGKAFTEKRLYWDCRVKGYHFIVLNTEKDLKDNAYLTKEQLSWLKEVLKEDEGKGRPIFVTIHQTFKGTGDHMWQDWIYDPAQIPENDPLKFFDSEEALKEILKPYGNRLLIFTGHVHNGQDIARIYQENYGYVVDMPSFLRDDYGLKSKGAGYQVNVKGNFIQLKMRDYLKNQWVENKVYDIFLQV